MQLAVTSAVSTVHIFYAPYMCTNNFTVSISNYEVRWTPRACKPHIPLNLAWFLQFVFLHLCLLSKSLWSRLKSIFSKSGEVKFPPSRRLKSTWRHSKSKSGQITLGRVTPRSNHNHWNMSKTWYRYLVHMCQRAVTSWPAARPLPCVELTASPSWNWSL